MSMRENMEWQNAEIDSVLNLITIGETYDNISRNFQRKIKSIKLKVMETVCKRIDEGRGLEEYYCNEYDIKKNDIDNFRKTSS